MGKIVAAVAASHILMGSRGVEEQALRVTQGLKKIGKHVREANPNLIVCLSCDHMVNLLLHNIPAFCVGIGEKNIANGEMDIPKVEVLGHKEFARLFVENAFEHEFDLATSEELRLDHGIMIPILYSNPNLNIPVVPILININSEPMPNVKRCVKLAKVLKDTIENKLPEHERVAVIATGGLSHWLPPGTGKINEEWDHMIMDTISSGMGEKLYDLSNDEILKCGGNGGQEIKTWIMMSAMVPEKKGNVIFYEPIPSWATGMGGLIMNL